MTVREKDGAVYVTGLDLRERSEVRRLVRPELTAAERMKALRVFLAERGSPAPETAEIFVWA